MTPTYINILNVYAFCNTHDITWGTKGDDKPEKLSSVNLKPGGKVDVDIPTDDADLNTQYDNELKMLSVKAAKEEKQLSPAEKQEDYYKGFRSAVVLVWMFCNFALAAVVLSAAGLERVSVDEDVEQSETDRRANIFMAVVLWSVAGLSAFRFIGAVWFLIIRAVRSSSSSSSFSLLLSRQQFRVSSFPFSPLLSSPLPRLFPLSFLLYPSPFPEERTGLTELLHLLSSAACKHPFETNQRTKSSGRHSRSSPLSVLFCPLVVVYCGLLWFRLPRCYGIHPFHPILFSHPILLSRSLILS